MSVKPRLPPNKFAMWQVFRLWQTPPGPIVMKAHGADASQRQAYCSELALQGGRVVKGGGADELQHPILVSNHDRIAGGCGMQRYTLLFT